MIGFILNLPYTITGLIVSLFCIPFDIKFKENPYAIIFKVKSFRWAIGYLKGARAMAIGHVILLGPNLEDKDLEHELVHVRQHQRMPLVQPILYYIELLRKGYKNNKYEMEAYRMAGNIYKEK